MKQIYLASPFFNDTELVVYKETISRLRNAGYKVHVPRSMKSRMPGTTPMRTGHGWSLTWMLMLCVRPMW